MGSSKIQEYNLDPNCGFAKEETAQEILDAVSNVAQSEDVQEILEKIDDTKNQQDGESILIGGGTFTSSGTALSITGSGYLHFCVGKIPGATQSSSVSLKIEIDGTIVYYASVKKHGSSDTITGYFYIGKFTSDLLGLSVPMKSAGANQTLYAVFTDATGFAYIPEGSTEQLIQTNSHPIAAQYITNPIKFSESLKVTFVNKSSSYIGVGYTLGE